MLKVLGNRLLIKPDPVVDFKEEEMKDYQNLKKSGFDLVRFNETEKKKQERAAQHVGTVAQIGHAAWFDFPSEYQGWCKVGDRVVYQRHSGKFIVDPETEEEFIIINDNDVQCLIKEGKKGKK